MNKNIVSVDNSGRLLTKPEPVTIKVKKLTESVQLPAYAKTGDAGLDLIATSIEIQGEITVYGTSLAFEIPEGYVGLIFPRSSIRNKTQTLTNSVGVIDSGYRGEVKFVFKDLHNPINEIYQGYKVGEKIGQLIIIPYPEVTLEEVQELSDSERGTGGFGSSGA